MIAQYTANYSQTCASRPAIFIIMPQPYQQPHWDTFINTPGPPIVASKQSPYDWANRFGIQSIPDAHNLSSGPLNRIQLRNICQNNNIDVLFAYVCCMAWGRQSKVHAAKAWEHRKQIAPILSKLRGGGLSRLNAYHLFVNGNRNRFPGLGPSYFTKLIHFFSPSKSDYIIDNYVLKSIEVLTGLPYRKYATPGGYLAACWEIDQMARILGVPGETIEIRLFSGPWTQWRIYCNQIQNLRSDKTDYKRQMSAIYSHSGPKIPLNEFDT